MKYLALIAAAGLAGAALAAQAAHEGQGPGRMLERLRQADTNHDGMISRDEAAALPMISKHFDEIDANHDGQITTEELRAFHQRMRGEHWKRIDTDGDGRISRAEAQANAPRLAEHFDELDANKDGYLTPDELAAAHRGRRHGQ
jgi:Ca2+-binding EF-hand superfamily protein